MNDTDTPETDAARVQFFEVQGRVIVELDPQGDWVSMEFAAKLERERDAARREAEASWDCKWPKPFWSWRTKDDA